MVEKITTTIMVILTIAPFSIGEHACMYAYKLLTYVAIDHVVM